jgi:hypothetical protein
MYIDHEDPSESEIAQIHLLKPTEHFLVLHYQSLEQFLPTIFPWSHPPLRRTTKGFQSVLLFAVMAHGTPPTKGETISPATSHE